MPVVHHLDEGVLLIGPGAQLDHPAWLGVVYRIGDQVAYHLIETASIAKDDYWTIFLFEIKLNLHFSCLSLPAETGSHIAEQLIGI